MLQDSISVSVAEVEHSNCGSLTLNGDIHYFLKLVVLDLENSMFFGGSLFDSESLSVDS